MHRAVVLRVCAALLITGTSPGSWSRRFARAVQPTKPSRSRVALTRELPHLNGEKLAATLVEVYLHRTCVVPASPIVIRARQLAMCSKAAFGCTRKDNRNMSMALVTAFTRCRVTCTSSRPTLARIDRPVSSRISCPSSPNGPIGAGACDAAR